MTFGDWVKYKRRKLGLSQRALAIQTGLAVLTIQNIERCRSSAFKSTIQKIESVLGPYREEMRNEELGIRNGGLSGIPCSRTPSIGISNPLKQKNCRPESGHHPFKNDLALAKAQGILNRVIRHCKETKKEAKEALKEIAKLL